jgi:TPR repeat protein
MEKIDSQVNLPPGQEQFLKGISLLTGVGAQKDESMAAASLLDSSDLDNPSGLFACALIYFCGVGVTRNAQTASEFAQKYLQIDPKGAYSKLCMEVIDGSVGSSNALKALYALGPSAGSSGPAAFNANLYSTASAAKNKKLYLVGGGAAALVVAIALFVLVPRIGGPLPASSAPDAASLFSSDEITEAKRKALEQAGLVRTEARNEAMKGSK